MKEKYLIFVFAALFMASKALVAQSAIGVKTGVNYNYLGYSFEHGYGDRFGYAFGAFG
jgi:hypothetical protein